MALGNRALKILKISKIRNLMKLRAMETGTRILKSLRPNIKPPHDAPPRDASGPGGSHCASLGQPQPKPPQQPSAAPTSPTRSSLLQNPAAPHLLWGLHQHPPALESATHKSPSSPWVGVNPFPKSTALGGNCRPLPELQEAEVFASREFSSEVIQAGETLA